MSDTPIDPNVPGGIQVPSDPNAPVQPNPDPVPPVSPDPVPPVNPEPVTDADTPRDNVTSALDSHDKIDAILRDPNVPGDVRSFVSTVYSVTRYLEGVDFYTDDSGVTHTRLREG